jgi:hypothetical protein
MQPDAAYRYPAPPPTNEDANHLQILSILHYVLGALVGLVGCISILYIVLGAVFVADAPAMASPGSPPPPPAFGAIFIVFGSMILLFAWGLAACLIAAGVCLTRRRRHTFCVIIAALSCLWMPFGTILGVFTLVVLNRASVKALFGAPV